MLVSLHVENLALIHEVQVEFAPGLNIFTGETGAGKSLLLGSIQLLLGAKASREMIREGADYCLVELLFQVENPRTKEALEKQEISLDEGQLLLSRKVMENRSVGRINGRTCTMAQLKEAASLLLDIHGQHEHQSLLYPKKQLEILDAYGGKAVEKSRLAVEKAFESYRSLKEELDSMNLNEESRKREMDFLAYELSEIEKAAPAEGEDEELERQYRRMNNSKEILEALSFAHDCTGYDRRGAGDLVGEALGRLQKATDLDEGVGELFSALSDIDGLLNDFNRELSGYREDLTFEEEEFYRVERRLDELNGLKVKYGPTIARVLAQKEEKARELEKLENYGERMEELKKRLDTAEKEYLSAAHELTKIRQSYGIELEEKIVDSLKDLHFLEVEFSIAFSARSQFSPEGMDQVEYRISTNPGEAARALNKVVSGGELSRIMLAVKTLLADKDQIETLIFDEIDTGISGRTAQKVSEKLDQIGRCRQVLCITHLPQIAAMADAHYEIRKTVENGGTHTRIYPLDPEASVKELSRMLGGAQITQRVEESAKEMKDLAQVHKNARLK